MQPGNGSLQICLHAADKHPGWLIIQEDPVAPDADGAALKLAVHRSAQGLEDLALHIFLCFSVLRSRAA
jgi:hypothetical protein